MTAPKIKVTNEDKMWGKIMGPHVSNEMVRDAVYNEYRIRAQMMSMFLDPRRNIEAECGYPDVERLTAVEYKKLYDGEPIARRVVNLYPRECWQRSPWVGESEDVDKLTPFDLDLVEVNKGLMGTSFYTSKEGEGSPVFRYLRRVDEAAGIGRFGALLFGFDDRQLLEKPVELKKEGFATVIRKLLFLRSLDETQIKPIEFETEQTSERFTLPTMYEVKSPNFNNQKQVGETTTVKVHWTRILHVSKEAELYSQPLLQVPYKRLYDLFKLYGGSAEMYWKGAFFGLSIETQPEMVGKVKPLTDPQKQFIRSQLEQYSSGLDRTLLMGNMTVKTLAPQVVDPSKHIDGQIQAICIDLACPVRVFMGSERGELSSDQDGGEWDDRLVARNNDFTTPGLVVPFHDRLIQTGCTRAPTEYYCSWDQEVEVSPVEQATITLQRTQAMAAYVAGNVMELMEPKDYLMRELKYSEEEAKAILENRMEGLRLEDNALEMKDAEAEAAQQLADQGQAGLDQAGELGHRKLDIEEKKVKVMAKKKPAA